MAHKHSFGLPHSILPLASLGIFCATAALAQAPASRLAGDWHSTPSVRVPGAAPLAAQTASDLGAAQPGLRLERMLLLLAPSAAQEQALLGELDSQQNPASPEFQHWLTPGAFAGEYSNSAADVAAVSAWLENRGLQVAPLPAGRGWIEFSGTVAQVEQAFETQIDSFQTAAGPRPALAGSISVPAALLPVVQGLVSLDGALATPALTAPQSVSLSAAELAAQSSLGKAAALTPQLAAQLLHFDALNAAGADGAGEAIAIAARSNVQSADIAAFRAAFSLRAATFTSLPNGPDPGFSNDQAQATLAASWAGAAAPGARILLVPAATTDATDGLDLSLAAIVDQALAHTVSVGYSNCEAALSPAHQAFYSALYKQAAAEGIAIVAASGDSGPSACHAADIDINAPVTSGYAVNALASTPWNTAVGVAAFGAAGPTADLSTLAAWSPLNAADPAYAGGGGSSTQYAAPRWQSVPEGALTAPGHRLLPDLALPTAADSGINHGLAFCLSGSTPVSGCRVVRAGGSSAAAALFAGIGALVAQRYGAQGNLAPNLHALSRFSGVYSDIQQGSAQLRCVVGSPGCGATEQIGYAAGAGFDMATGLGVVNAKSMVTLWTRPLTTGSSLVTVTNTTATGQTINPSGSVVLSANVVSQIGGPTPTGTVTFFDQSAGATVTTVGLIPVSGDTSSASVTVTGVLAQGSHTIVAQYSGDSVYAAANDPVGVVVQSQPSPTSTVVTPATSTPSPGSALTVTAVVTSTNAGTGAQAPSGTVNFTLDGVSQGSKPVVPGVPAAPSTNSTSSISITVPYSAGAHQIVGIYSGDTNYTGSTSSAASITVSQSTPSIVLTPSTTTPEAGSSLQLTAAITPPGSGSTPPTGTVVFTLDGATVGSASVVASSPASRATITITAPASGAHTLQATYQGDSNYFSATSAPVSINVVKASTTVTLTPATTTPTAGSSLLLTATITPNGSSSAIPTGTVTFTMDGTNVGIVAVSSGTTASTTITVPASGSHTLQATYSGDSNFTGSTSSGVTITVAKITTTLAISPSTTTPTGSSPLTVTATINPASTGSASPTGTVVFSLDGAPIGTLTVVAGSPSTATITTTTPASGAHTLQATYSGDINYSGSTSPTATITVTKSAPSVVVTPATTTPAMGSSLVVSATITPPGSGGVAPTGSVTFSLDGTTVGTGLVAPGSPSTASVTITAPSVGVHILAANYSGDTNYTSVVSPGASITVGKATPTLTVTPPTTPPTGGSSMLVTATLTSTALGIAVPTGTVTFSLDGAVQGTAPLTGGTTASLSITVPVSGTHTLQASYSGDSNYNTALSPPASFTVAKASTTLAITPSTNTPTGGGPLTITATITPSGSGIAPPTGTVTFSLDGVPQGTQAVTAGNPSTSSITITAPATGTHTLQATYSGDTNYTGSTSPSASITVAKSAPVVVASLGTQPPTVGSPLVVSATITPPISGGAAPTGSVVFTIDGAIAGTGLVVPGSPSTASVTVTAPSVGAHTLVANYSGDTNYTSAISAGAGFTVGKGTPTLTVTPPATAPIGGTSMVVTATLGTATPGSPVPTGTVTFSLDGATQGTAPLVAGITASLSITAPTSGTHTLQATYSGDSNYNTTVSSLATFTVAKSPTTIVLSPISTPPPLGSPLPVTATITSNNPAPTLPSGTVTFTVDGVTAGVASVVPGLPATATATLAALSPGAHTVVATYSGDTSYSSSTSTATTVTIPKSTTALVVTPATITPPGGSALGVSATITPTMTGSTLPTGTVTFSLDGTPVGVSAVVPGSPSTATATIAGTSITPGTHALTASYSGDSYYGASNAAAVTLAVAKGATTTVLTPSTTTPTAGGSMSVNIAVSSPNPGGTFPTGTVTVTLDGAVVGTTALVSGSPSTASVTVPVVSAGSHILAASYSGDTFYTGSNSASVAIVAAKGLTTTTLTAAPPALTPGENELFTATVAPANAVAGAVYTITGTVNFYDGTVLLGKVPISNNTAILTAPVLANNVTHSITAIYSGDSNWLPSSSSILSLAPTTLPVQVVLTSNYSTVLPGQALILTATVTPSTTPAAGYEQNPTGMVTFYNGTTVLGTSSLTPVTIGGASTISDASVATLTTLTLPGGQDTVYAFYAGDNYYTATTSNLLALTIEDFSITPAPTNPATNLNIVKGSAGSASYIVTGLGGFANQIQVVCAVPPQDDMTCTASPQEVVPPGTITFTVQTFTTGGPSTTSRLDRRPQPFWPRAAGGTALAALAFFLLPFGRRARIFAGRNTRRFLILLLLLVGVGSAGMGCTDVTGSATKNNLNGTPLGVATLKITASANEDNTVYSHSVYLTVNVLAPGSII
jgi:subtilase family serine protease